MSSRLGLHVGATEVAAGFDFWSHVVGELDTDVFAFGILTDFRTRMFPGSMRLVELADRTEVLQVRALCWCGEPAPHNARTVAGERWSSRARWSSSGTSTRSTAWEQTWATRCCAGATTAVG